VEDSHEIPAPDTALDSRLRQLESDLATQRREMRQLSSYADRWRQRAVAAERAVQTQAAYAAVQPSFVYAGNESSTLAEPPPTFQPSPAVFQQPTNQSPSSDSYQQSVSTPLSRRPGNRGRRGGAPARRRQDHFDTESCFICGQRGHWRAGCPYSAAVAQFPPNNVAGVQNCCSFVSSESYIHIKMECGRKKREMTCLLDSGCDENILPKRLAKKFKMNAADEQTVYAANGTSIAILGSIHATIFVGGQKLREKFLLCDEVDECILGFHFLKRHGCTWCFNDNKVVINGETIPLQKRTGSTQIRRIYVRESVRVPADVSINLPVRMPYNDLFAPQTDWVTEAKTLRPGVYLARTLLPETDCFAAVYTVNMSGREQFLRRGLCLGIATPGECVCEDVKGCLSDRETTLHNDHVVKESECEPKSRVTVVTRQPQDPVGQFAAGNEYVSRQEGFSHDASVGPGDGEGLPPHNSSAPDWSILTEEEIFAEFENDFGHLKPILDGLPTDFNSQERRQIAELLLRNSGSFSASEFDIGCTNLLQQRINTGNHPPISEPLRRHPRAHLDLIDDTVSKLQEAGVVEPAISPWAANVVLVKKKDSDVPRVTIDYRKLNAVTVKDKHPLPRIKDCLDALSGSTLFTTCDVSMSFYSLPLAPEDRPKTAFVTRRGQFQFRRSPMGISNSPAAFSRLMALALRGLTYLIALTFVDDVIIVGRNFAEHLKNVETVLQRFKRAQLLLKPKKCSFFQKEVRFLGHVVSAEGIAVDPRKTAVIRQWPFPKNISELRGFLGLCGFYRAYCKGFAEIAAPLTEMLKKTTKVEPNPERLEAFEQLKYFLTTPHFCPCPGTKGNG